MIRPLGSIHRYSFRLLPPCVARSTARPSRSADGFIGGSSDVPDPSGSSRKYVMPCRSSIGWAARGLTITLLMSITTFVVRIVHSLALSHMHLFLWDRYVARSRHAKPRSGVILFPMRKRHSFIKVWCFVCRSVSFQMYTPSLRRRSTPSQKHQ